MRADATRHAAGGAAETQPPRGIFGSNQDPEIESAMLRMCAELGFDVADDPGGSGIKLATLELARSP